MFFLDNLTISPSGSLDLLSKNKNTVGTPSIDRTKLYVSRTKPIPDKKHLAKKHACYFCKKLLSDQMPQHLRTVHSDKKLIKDALKLGKEESNAIIKKLVN